MATAMMPWIVFACFLYALIRLVKHSKMNRLPLPPGPKGLPFIGNSWDIPKEFEWVTYHEWCKQFNTEILYLNLGGTPLIVLDTYEAINDLLEKRSSIFSNRPQFTMQSELMGLNFNFAFMDYGKQKHRRLMHQHLHVGSFNRLLRLHSLKASRNLLNRFLVIPGDVMENLRHMAGETIMAIAYGLQVRDRDDPYISTAERAVHTAFIGAVPGKFMVNSFPMLKYIPAWMPGASFMTTAKDCRELLSDMVTLPYTAAKKNIASGDYTPSFTSRSLEDLANAKGKVFFDETVIQNNAGAMYMAGSDTTVSILGSCILGILENPEVLVAKRAQEELDRVVKPGQLPDFDDEKSLPYITAITKESLRWRDVVPTGVARKLLVEAEYKGYRLPAGSIVLSNSWAVLHDNERYPDPFRFNPDRFLTKDGKLDDSIFDPERACWGFGRRICPGRYVAYSAIWINIATMLTVFDIKKQVDGSGNVIEPKHDYMSGMLLVPKPFQCCLTPRSDEAEQVIRAYATGESSRD